MKQITVYRTYSYGGVEGRTREADTFETIELAKANALQNDWNDNYRLYEVVITFNGRVEETEKFLGEIACGRDKKNKQRAMEEIVRAEQRLAEHKANCKIKEATREKRIAEEERFIAWQKNIIERIEKRA